MQKENRVYHIATPAQWQAALQDGKYTHPSLTEEGFIHCSFSNQVLQTAEKHFTERRGLIVLCIDVSALDTPLLLERSVPGEPLFPHIYGCINLGAVTQVIELDREKPSDLFRSQSGQQ